MPKGCVHCVSVSVRVIRSVGTGVLFCFFSCDVWSVCSHEVRLEEKGVAGDGDGDEAGDGQDIIEKGYLNTGLVVFHSPHYLTIVFFCFSLVTFLPAASIS